MARVVRARQVDQLHAGDGRAVARARVGVPGNPCESAPSMRAPMAHRPDKWHPVQMPVPMPDPATGITALALRLVGRRHVDLHRVSSAICR